MFVLRAANIVTSLYKLFLRVIQTTILLSESSASVTVNSAGDDSDGEAFVVLAVDTVEAYKLFALGYYSFFVL